MGRQKKTTIFVLFFFSTGLIGGAVYLIIDYGYLEKILAAINTDLPLPLFMVFMVFLPVVGFPISVFLIIAGIKFGILQAVLLWLLILPFHTLIGYAAASYLRPLLEKLLSNTLGYAIPTVPAHNDAMFSFLFLAIPGLPYAAKNYLLPLAGVSFRYCVVMNCLVQSLLGLPFILLGQSAAEMNPVLFYIAVILLILLFLLLHRLKR